MDKFPHSKDLHRENEFAKIKLELERGAKFYTSSDSDLLPEIESQWLKNIQQFEEMSESCEQVTVYEFCGKPSFKAIEELQGSELAEALQQLYELLATNEIALDCLCPVDEAELYRFITLELFAHEIDDMRIPGMRHCFTYEDFHPNDQYDIEAACRDFIGQVIREEFPEENTFMWMATEFNTCEGFLPEERAFEKLREAHAKYRALSLEYFESNSIIIEERSATALFNTRYSGRDENNKIEFSGPAKFMLECRDGFWIINRFELPGFEI